MQVIESAQNQVKKSSNRELLKGEDPLKGKGTSIYNPILASQARAVS